MKKLLLIFITMAGIALHCHAQSGSGPLKIGDAYLMSGVYTYPINYVELTTFQRLAPRSELLNTDLSNYGTMTVQGTNGSGVFAPAIGIRLSDRTTGLYKLNPQLRAGLIFFGGSDMQLMYNKEQRYPYDTLTSSRTGDAIYIDSIYQSTYHINHNSSKILLDLAVIFRTRSETRWSLFGGIGTNGGLITNSYVSISRHESDYLQIRDYYTRTGWSFSQPGHEEHATDLGFYWGIYLPAGLDFRIGKQNAFWQKVHLFYELRLGLSVTSIPGTGSIAGNYYQHGLGLRISWADALLSPPTPEKNNDSEI